MKKKKVKCNSYFSLRDHFLLNLFDLFWQRPLLGKNGKIKENSCCQVKVADQHLGQYLVRKESDPCELEEVLSLMCLFIGFGKGALCVGQSSP